jgi:hypothetical protein
LGISIAWFWLKSTTFAETDSAFVTRQMYEIGLPGFPLKKGRLPGFPLKKRKIFVDKISLKKYKKIQIV